MPVFRQYNVTLPDTLLDFAQASSTSLVFLTKKDAIISVTHCFVDKCKKIK